MKKNIDRKGFILCMVIAMALTGCGNTTADSKGEVVKGTGDAAAVQGSELSFDGNVNPKGEFPIVKEKIALTIAIRSDPQVSDYEVNEYTQWLEEKSNIDLNFVMLPNKETEAKINLMFAAGKDLPDVVITGSIKNDSLYKYALDGLVLPLNDYIAEYGIEYQRMLNENPGLEKACIALDGKTYGLPKYNVTLHNQMRSGKMYLYKPWLDKLGLEVPKTTEELYGVLKAFKTQDPNGNGIADEVPMAGCLLGGGTDPRGMMNSFIPYSYEMKGLINNNGTLDVVFNKDEFKQGLEYMNKLVSEKLLDPVSFTQDQQQLKALANRTEMILGGFIHGYTAINATDMKVLDYVCLPLLESGTGKGGFLRDPLLPQGASFVITSSCENPEAAFRLGDLMLGQEASMRNRYGVEDRDWKKLDSATTDLVGLDGKSATFEILNNIWSETTATIWRSECLLYNEYNNVYGKGMPADAFNPDKYHHDNTINCYQPYVVGDIVPLKSMFFTEDELSEFTMLDTSLNEYVEQQFAAFCTGSRSLSEWDAYKAELENLRLSEWLRYVQTAYDRQFAE